MSFAVSITIVSAAVNAESLLTAEPLSAADLRVFYENQDATSAPAAPPKSASDSAPLSAPLSTSTPIPTPTANASRTAGDFQLTFSPALWMARVRANSSLNGATFIVDDDLGLNGYEPTLNGELSASWGVFYKVMATGWFFSTDATTTATTAGSFGSVNMLVGDQLSNSFSAAGAGCEFDVTLWQPFADQQTPWGQTIVNARNTATDGGYKADLRFKALGAVRWYSASLSVSDQTAGTNDSWSMDAVMPGIGAGIELDFNLKGRIPWVQSINMEATGGTGSNFTNGQYFTFVRAGVSAMFTPHCGVQFGYRLEDFKLDNNSAIFDGGVQGLFLGINVKF